jgi:lipoate-protein ligase B
MEELLSDKKLLIADMGLCPYETALEVQQRLCADRQADKIQNTVLLAEHPAVITLGARKTENKLIASPADIKTAGIELIQIGRGGAATAHNPGQIVVYPIIKLKSLNLGITEYIRELEQIGIELLAELGVVACRRKGLPGLWVENDKIASIGVQLKKWVTFHGMAVNINNDLSIFDYIVPCGLENIKMTSAAQQTGKQYNIKDVKKIAAQLCGQLFRLIK